MENKEIATSSIKAIVSVFTANDLLTVKHVLSCFAGLNSSVDTNMLYKAVVDVLHSRLPQKASEHKINLRKTTIFNNTDF